VAAAGEDQHHLLVGHEDPAVGDRLDLAAQRGSGDGQLPQVTLRPGRRERLRHVPNVEMHGISVAVGVATGTASQHTVEVFDRGRWARMWVSSARLGNGQKFSERCPVGVHPNLTSGHRAC